MKKLICYTDGSALTNPWPGWWAWVIVEWSNIVTQWSGWTLHATNNQMELQAVIDVLIQHLPDWSTPVVDQWLFGEPVAQKTTKITVNPLHLTIITDSTYVQQWVTQWLETWVRRWWRRSKWWKSIANLDQWMKLHSMLEYFSNLTRERTRAHVWTEWNERADREAKKQAILHSR
jgi:ribonuclease HI